MKINNKIIHFKMNNKLIHFRMNNKIKKIIVYKTNKQIKYLL